MVFHLIALNHLPQSRKYMSCAFTQKNRKLAKMLTSLGHTVYFYASEGSDVEEYCNSDKLIFKQTHTLEEIRQQYGDGDNRYEIGYDWTKGDFRHDFNKTRNNLTKIFNQRTINLIDETKQEDHFILATQGSYHKDITDKVGLYLTCEPGIGYRGSVKGMFRAFESPYIMHFTYGSENPHGSSNGSFYDRVIPNYFADEDFQYNDKKEDYLLFVGRMIRRKGVQIAYETAKALNMKLIFAGQGAYVDERGYLRDNDPQEYEIPPGNWEYVGYVDPEKRKNLMSNATALFSPTLYLECFAGVHVEAMLSGTPPITTNFGVYPYTIPDHLNGKIGFRCNTLDDFVNAAINAKNVNHQFVRLYAERFLMDNVKYEFEKWFQDLYQVFKSTKGDKGWHFISPKTYERTKTT